MRMFDNEVNRSKDFLTWYILQRTKWSNVQASKKAKRKYLSNNGFWVRNTKNVRNSLGRTLKLFYLKDKNQTYSINVNCLKLRTSDNFCLVISEFCNNLDIFWLDSFGLIIVSNHLYFILINIFLLQSRRAEYTTTFI